MENYNDEIKKAIQEAEQIARTGTPDEKRGFVAWACEALRWLSFQGDAEGVRVVSAQYKAYLRALN